METKINDLPDEVLARIFTHLDNKSFWSRINLVTRAWNSIWNNDILVKKRKTVDTRICHKKFNLPYGEMDALCSCIDICGDILGCLMRNEEYSNQAWTNNKFQNLKLTNLKTGKYQIFSKIINGSKPIIQLYEKKILIRSYSKIRIYEYDMDGSILKLIHNCDIRLDDNEHLITKQDQYIQLYNNKLNIYSNCDISNKISELNLRDCILDSEIYKYINANTFAYDDDCKVFYIGGLFYDNFNVLDESFNIIHSNKFETEARTHNIKKIEIYKNRIYLVCENWTKKNMDEDKNWSGYSYSGNKDKHRSAFTIIILDRYTYKVLSKHNFDYIDIKFLCFAKNLIIYKLYDQMNRKLNMKVYDINEKTDVKNIKLDVLWSWMDMEYNSVPEYGNIVNYNDEKLIIISKEGLLYFKLR
jgi:hypothetical protein